jgi:hypothetical protein
LTLKLFLAYPDFPCTLHAYYSFPLFQQNISTFNEELNAYNDEVDKFPEYGDIAQLAQYHEKANELNNKLNEAANTIEQFNQEEATFGLEETFYPLRKQVSSISQTLIIFFKFYTVNLCPHIVDTALRRLDRCRLKPYSDFTTQIHLLNLSRRSTIDRHRLRGHS